VPDQRSRNWPSIRVVRDGLVFLPVNLFQLRRSNRLLIRNSQDELAIARPDLSTIRQKNFQADFRSIDRQHIDLEGVGKAGQRFVPVGIV
jgi:hypothetical protein